MASIVAAVVAASLAMATASLAVAAEQRLQQRAVGLAPAPTPVAGARSIPETWAEPKARTLSPARRASGKSAVKHPVKRAAQAAGFAGTARMGRAAPPARLAATLVQAGPRPRTAPAPVRSRTSPLAVPASAITDWRFDAATSAAAGPDSARWPVAVDAMANRMALFWGRQVMLGVGARGWTGDVQARPQRWGLRVTLRVALPP